MPLPSNTRGASAPLTRPSRPLKAAVCQRSDAKPEASVCGAPDISWSPPPAAAIILCTVPAWNAATVPTGPPAIPEATGR